MERSDTTTPPGRGASRDPPQRPSHGQPVLATALPPGFRHRSEDSWIEVSSQPSSSSLSSAADEIVTEGLRVQHDSDARRRRRVRTTGSLQVNLARRHQSTGESSQDEYEESESESDRAMVSSSEGPRPSSLQPELRRYNTSNAASLSSAGLSEGDAQEDEDDDDENSTAVNYPRTSIPHFTPQPNAFTHPPRSQRHHSASVSYNPSRPTAARSASHRHSYPSQQHTPYNMISPAHQADHDAALRASLSTLLSLGAAARGLPKSTQATTRTPAVASSRVDPSTIRMVSESVALGGESLSPSTKPSSTPSEPESPLSMSMEKQKRKANVTSQPRSSSKDRQRTMKKARRATSMEEISPTLLTWVLSAGVVVLFSAIGFSAGYVVGKENGRAEMLGQLGGAATGDAGRCGREAVAEAGRSGLGLKRLRWGGVGAAASSVRV